MIGPASGWFSRPVQVPQLTAEEKLQKQLEWAARNTWARAVPIEVPPKIEARKNDVAKAKRRAENKILQDEAARRRIDAKLILKREEKKRETRERMDRIVVEVRGPKNLKKPER